MSANIFLAAFANFAEYRSIHNGWQVFFVHPFVISYSVINRGMTNDGVILLFCQIKMV